MVQSAQQPPDPTEVNSLTGAVKRFYPSSLSPHKSRISLFLRIGISVGLLSYLWVTMEVDPTAIWPSSKTAAWWLLAAFCAKVASLVLASFRWQQSCRALGLQASLPRLFWHMSAGQFLSNFIPTTIGGDILRMTRLSRDTKERSLSFTSVIFERLSGWIVLPACTFIGLALDPDLRTLGAATRIAVLAALVTLAILGGVVLLASFKQSGRLLAKMPGPLRSLHAIHVGVTTLAKNPIELFRVVLAAGIYQAVLIMAFWFSAQSLGMEQFGVRAAFAFVPAVLIIQVIPIGIGGLGVRETALTLFLAPLGVSGHQAVALGLTVYVLTLLMSLLGVPSFAFGGNGRAQMEEEARAMNEAIDQTSEF